MRKLLLPLLFIFSVVLLVSCNDIALDANLPNLEDKQVSEIQTILDDLKINYTIQYETNLKVDENIFIAYGNDYQVGDLILKEESLIVIVSSKDIYLPDFTGMSQTDILRYLRDKGITNYDIEIVEDNSVADQTFLAYEDHQIGDKVPSTEDFIIQIAFNVPELPDLTGKIQRQIGDTLTNLLIKYKFIYEENDDMPAGTFARYKDYSIGDLYEDDNATIEVVLYSNSFTDASKSLFISKYLDGVDDNKAIELYNPTDQTIDLKDYHLAIFENGSYEVTYPIEFDASATIAPGEVYLIVSRSSDPALKDMADLVSRLLIFDGNDTIQLRYKNNTYIDTIYQIGDRGFAMDNELFVRRESVTAGKRIFTLSEWTPFVPDYIEIIGSHPIDIEDRLFLTEFEIAELISRGFFSPLGGMIEVTAGTINDGDTVHFMPGFTGDKRVRFIGNDTPETYPLPAQPWGLEAKAYTTAVINYARDNDKTIYLQSDPDIGYTEGYGRHLGLVWIDLGTDVLLIDIKDSDGNVLFTEELTGLFLLNYHIVKNGFSANEYASKSMLTANNRFMYRWFNEAEMFAKENKLGVNE